MHVTRTIRCRRIVLRNDMDRLHGRINIIFFYQNIDMLMQYDISADWWLNTIERLNRGITFKVPWYDSNTIMTMNTEKAT